MHTALVQAHSSQIPPEPSRLQITVKGPQDTLKILDGIRKFDLVLLEHQGAVELPKTGAKPPLAVKLMLKLLFSKEHFMFISGAADTAAALLMGSGAAEAKEGVSLGPNMASGVELLSSKASELRGKGLNALVLADACRNSEGGIDCGALQEFFRTLSASNTLKTAALLSIGESIDTAALKTLAAQGITAIEVRSPAVSEIYRAALQRS